MKQFFSILYLHFIDTFQRRGKSFVYILELTINPLLLLFFWTAASKTNSTYTVGWSQSAINSYYLLLTIVTALMMSYIEEEVGDDDIYEGGLTPLLLKPYPYFVLKLFREIPSRLLQGCIGIGFFFLIGIILKLKFTLSVFIGNIPLLIILIVLAYCTAFTFKMIVGILAFWFTDTKGVFNVAELTMVLLGGYIMPLPFLPHWIQTLSNATPFPYVIYYPIAALQGSLNMPQILSVILMQLIWIGILTVGYQLIWKAGIKKYTGFGQ